ncbi:YggS family pyridoxal phosphate enzyme [Gordonia sp. NPDC058843]|uniref:YggS family pyridoxal phosphate enzyme n=1 Tax=Gordonia sp. NPDC058843 TaxID=3346648 RepID=UPI0036988EF0
MTGSSDARTVELGERLASVRRRLDSAVEAARRPAGSCELLVVTKFFPADDIRRLMRLGERAFGESREPEAGRKVASVLGDWVLGDRVLGDRESPDPGDVPVFDMIGSVQSKKARSVARWARTVHSVDRPKVVDALDRATAAALDEHERADPLGILLQVSLDGDPQRGGVVEDDLPGLAELVVGADSLRLRGLMVIAPLNGHPEYWMAETARIHEAFRGRFDDAAQLSAGMSGDMETAIAAGSTCVRVGTGIMGERPLVSQ